jgi:IgGFc binding protein
MSLLSPWKSAVVVGFVATVFVACSSSKEGFLTKPQEFGTPDSGTDAAPPPPSSCEGRRCSRDLHSVVDGCTGETLETCASELGCALGKCVSACESAAASQGSIGCSFWAVPPDTAPFSVNSCHAAFMANTWNTPVKVTAEYGSDPLDISQSVYRASIAEDGRVLYERIDGPIPPGEVGIVFLAQGEQRAGDDDYIACPEGVNVAFRGTVIEEHRTSLYKAFHLSTDVPVSAYSIFPYGGAKSFVPSATLLIPSPSWDSNYFLIDGWKAQSYFPVIQIVAQEDDTEVRIRPIAAIKEGVGVPGAAKGFVHSWKLNRGQVLELAQTETLAGSPIETSHPVAIFGGNQCVDLPDTNVGACDSLHQQIPPLRQWASRYSAVPYKSRRVGLQGSGPTPEAVLWKVSGARDGTVLSYDPEPPEGAPMTLAAGQSVTFSSSFPFTVKSQSNDYPFYVGIYMTGAGKYATLGDPDYVNVIPDEQFLDRYIFFVDFTYADSTLTFIRRKDANGFHDVTLDCYGTITGWQPLGTDGSIEYAWVELTKNRKGVSTPSGTCSYGRHEATSDGGFGLYTWGLDAYASYGFPAGAGSRPTTPYTVEVR